MAAGWKFANALAITLLLASGNAFAQSSHETIGFVKTVAGSSSIVRSADRTSAASGPPLYEKD